MLRKKQVRMVTDFMGAVTAQGPQQSSVKQLLMGAGKTTVITPLLALFLADAKSLVAVVVPPALLEVPSTLHPLHRQCFVVIESSAALGLRQHHAEANLYIFLRPWKVLSLCFQLSLCFLVK